MKRVVILEKNLFNNPMGMVGFFFEELEVIRLENLLKHFCKVVEELWDFRKGLQVAISEKQSNTIASYFVHFDLVL